MNLPNFSWMVNVSELRYIQSTCESAEYRNPDSVVRTFLPFRRRLACVVRGKLLMSQLRAMPFYHYLLARTKYYDEVFLDAVHAGVSCIINIGCGGDTRAYRFEQLLKEKGITVVECDQPQAIDVKQRIARQHWPTSHIQYLPLDLHDHGWTSLVQLMDEYSDRPVMVMMEGVSPYIITKSFESFLRFLAVKLHPRSSLAYDYKIVNSAENSRRSAGVPHPFRLPAERDQVKAFHYSLGFNLEHMELSCDLARRLLPGAPPLFDNDCLLRLRPCEKPSP